MGYISVDVDVDDFIGECETFDIVAELKSRRNKPNFDFEELEPLFKGDFFKRLNTLHDQQKSEIITEAWDKYTPSELEQRLK